ncbi:histone-fold-containing protein [Trametes polyzona]|nr:histone-fold-containing protein [Trametes polyzona]
MPRAKESAENQAQSQQDAVADGIGHFELPRSVVMKLARASQVPENTKFSKDVVLAMVKASTVFINYLATAHEVASSKQHKSISATDVLKALELIEFADIAKDIQGELQVYRELQKADKKKGGKGKARDASDSTLAASKPKGKGKAAGAADQAPQQATPTIRIPGPSGPPPADNSTGVESEEHRRAEDVDEDQEMLDQDEEAGDDVDEDPEDDVEDEDVELEDTMALDEEEIRRDARGLEGHGVDDS